MQRKQWVVTGSAVLSHVATRACRVGHCVQVSSGRRPAGPFHVAKPPPEDASCLRGIKAKPLRGGRAARVQP